MRKLTPKEFQEIRLNYKPTNIKVLFIGEAPPAAGKFFYLAKSDLL